MVLFSIATSAICGCAPHSVHDWHAKLRVGTHSELTIESPRAREPDQGHALPAARLWVAAEWNDENIITLSEAWRAHYIERAGEVSYVSEHVTGSATFVEDNGETYLYVDFEALDPALDTKNIGVRRFRGFLPVVVEPPLALFIERDERPRPTTLTAPPSPPDWQGEPVPTFETAELPPELSFQEGHRPPAGYRHALVKSHALEIAGGITLPVAYAATVTIAAIGGFDDRQGWLAVPIVGPIIWWGPRTFGSNDHPEGGMAPAFFYMLVGYVVAIPQLVGAGLLIGGLLQPPRDRWLREDLSDDDVSFSVTPLPLQSGYGLAGTAHW